MMCWNLRWCLWFWQESLHVWLQCTCFLGQGWLLGMCHMPFCRLCEWSSCVRDLVRRCLPACSSLDSLVDPVEWQMVFPLDWGTVGLAWAAPNVLLPPPPVWWFDRREILIHFCFDDLHLFVGWLARTCCKFGLRHPGACCWRWCRCPFLMIGWCLCYYFSVRYFPLALEF